MLEEEVHYNTCSPYGPPTSLLCGNRATEYGLDQEETSCQQYFCWLHKHGQSYNETININCGLVISTSHPLLAATPDSWVVDPLATPSRGLVEFKIHAAART